MMRRILVDYARQRRYAKRGGGAHAMSLDEGLIVSEQRTAEVMNLDEALERLVEVDPRKSQIVELRFFGELPDIPQRGVCFGWKRPMSNADRF